MSGLRGEVLHASVVWWSSADTSALMPAGDLKKIFCSFASFGSRQVRDAAMRECCAVLV